MEVYPMKEVVIPFFSITRLLDFMSSPKQTPTHFAIGQ